MRYFFWIFLNVIQNFTNLWDIMLKPFLAVLLFLSCADASPSSNTQVEIDLVIPTDQKERYQILFEKIYELNNACCPNGLNQREIDILALQTALSYGKSGPEISEMLRQSAIKQWNKQNASPIVKQAVLKLLTRGMMPTNGYPAYRFESEYLNDRPLEERNRLKKEFEQAIAVFYPNVKKQLRHEWLKRMPSFETVDSAAYAAGLDHEAALDVYTALIGHQIYGWAISGFGTDDTDLKEMIWPQELGARRELLHRLYTESTRIENKWKDHEFTITDMQQYQDDASELKTLFCQLPRDIRSEIVVLSALNYTEKLPETLNKLARFTPEADYTLIGLTDRLFNQNLLSDYWRFAGIGLEHYFYEQIKPVADAFGMVPVFDSMQLVSFRKALVPERAALLHVNAIRQEPNLAHLISQQEARPISAISAEKLMGWSNNRELIQDAVVILTSLASCNKNTAITAEKAVINTVEDLANYVSVIDNTILASKYPRKRLEDLRHQFLMITFHPKAQSVNFDINPEFRSSLEKMFSNPKLNEFQTVLLEDHLMRLEQMLDRQIGYDTDILAHSSYYREKFIRELYPQVAHISIPDTSEASLRHFFMDGQRIFRRLQQLEIEVMTRMKETDKKTGLVLQEVLSEWESKDMLVHGRENLNDRLQRNLVMREMKDSPEKYANLSIANMTDTKMVKDSVFSWIVRDYVPGLGSPKI